MNQKDLYEDDLLRKFINPEKIEKAPEGFTSKTMTRVLIETNEYTLKSGILNKYLVPIISVLLTAGLIIIAVVIPSGTTGIAGSLLDKYLGNFKFQLPASINEYITTPRLPEWTAYAFIAFLLLVLFDRVLFRFFRKG